MTTPQFSAQFPVLDSVAYLNSGTCGPLPTAAVHAMAAATETSATVGRGTAYYDRLNETASVARGAWSRLLGAPSHELALTAGASDGVARTLSLIPWQPGDEVVVSDEEHPGLLGPLGALVRRTGVTVRTAPWHDLLSGVTAATKLIAVSHVSWLRGRVAELSALGQAGLPILLDGAQSAGAIPVDLAELRRHGVVAYAAAGQKWTCGPVGTGALWIDELWAPDRGIGVWPTYPHLADPSAGLGAVAWPDARRFDAPSLSGELLAGSVASLDVLEQAGWAAVHGAAIARAALLAESLVGLGQEVADRGSSTLVSWRFPDAESAAAAVLEAAQAGVTVRCFAGEPWVRASVGAWTTDDHIARLLDTVAT